MPEPVVEPIPLPPSESRLVVLLEAQEASYFAASLSISSFSITVGCATFDPYVPDMFLIANLSFRQSPRS
jgi:hypothetical protein